MSQPPFGLVPAGQPVITEPTEAPSPTSFLYAIPPGAPGAKPFSHIVVFLLPGVTLPPDTAAAIYLVTPGQSGPSSRFLGGIGPGKESAIFNLGHDTSAPPSSSPPVVIGVSVEPAGSVAQRIAERSSSSSSGAAGQQALVTARPSTLVLAQRIIRNAFNFLSGFSGTAGQVEVVPLKAFEDWWRKFEGRVRSDPGFLERDES
jgi:hypothetical protein